MVPEGRCEKCFSPLGCLDCACVWMDYPSISLLPLRYVGPFSLLLIVPSRSDAHKTFSCWIVSRHSARRVSKHEEAPLLLSCGARRDPPWHRDYRALTHTCSGSWLLPLQWPTGRLSPPSSCVVLVSSLWFPYQQSGDEGREVPILAGSGQGSHCAPAATLPQMEPSGSVASAPPGATAGGR